MIELTSLTPQLQAAHWGWTIAIFLWLVGLAGMPSGAHAEFTDRSI